VYKVLLIRLTNLDNLIVNSVRTHLMNMGFEVEVNEEIFHLNAELFNWERWQYNADKLLQLVKLTFERYPYDAVIGIGEADGFSDGLNFVFGLSTKKYGLVFLSRLKEEFYGRVINSSLYIERTLKEVTHELGHTLGLGHCNNKECVMNFSVSVEDVDKKGKYFCTSCSDKLNINNKS